MNLLISIKVIQQLSMIENFVEKEKKIINIHSSFFFFITREHTSEKLKVFVYFYNILEYIKGSLNTHLFSFLKV